MNFTNQSYENSVESSPKFKPLFTRPFPVSQIPRGHLSHRPCTSSATSNPSNPFLGTHHNKMFLVPRMTAMCVFSTNDSILKLLDGRHSGRCYKLGYLRDVITDEDVFRGFGKVKMRSRTEQGRLTMTKCLSCGL